VDDVHTLMERIFEGLKLLQGIGPFAKRCQVIISAKTHKFGNKS
jgi:hypothetical protein